MLRLQNLPGWKTGSGAAFRYYATGIEGIVEIESEWTAAAGTNGIDSESPDAEKPPALAEVGAGYLRN